MNVVGDAACGKASEVLELRAQAMHEASPEDSRLSYSTALRATMSRSPTNPPPELLFDRKGLSLQGYTRSISE